MVATGVGVNFGGKDAGRWPDPIRVGPASGATDSWAPRHTESVVVSTNSISSLLGTDRSGGGSWPDLSERDFDDKDRRFLDVAMVSLIIFFIDYHVSTDPRS